jgi:hypothetical protein
MELLKNSRLYGFILCLCITGVALAANDPLKSAVNTRLKAQKEAQVSQKRVDVLADETRDLLQEYRNDLQRIGSLRTYNDQLEKLIAKQKETLLSIHRQLENLEGTQRNIIPLMLRMLKVLSEYIALDLPFLQEERNTRVSVLKEMMDSPDVTLPDKFRRIMEAYQIEMEYGRTIEAYNGMINMAGKNQTVDILRLGRVALVYQTLDGKQSGQWDNKSKKWKILPGDYDRPIKHGIQIARKQAPPDFFRIPVNAAGK